MAAGLPYVNKVLLERSVAHSFVWCQQWQVSH